MGLITRWHLYFYDSSALQWVFTEAMADSPRDAVERCIASSEGYGEAGEKVHVYGVDDENAGVHVAFELSEPIGLEIQAEVGFAT